MSALPAPQPQDDPFANLQFYMPQEIRLERKDDKLVLSKQDVRLSLDTEDFQTAIFVLRWAYHAGLLAAEAEQAHDLLRAEVLKLTREGWEK